MIISVYSHCNLLGNNTRGNWTTEGCTLRQGHDFMENGTFICECTHLTNFAVLVVRSCRQHYIVGYITGSSGLATIACEELKTNGPGFFIITRVVFFFSFSQNINAPVNPAVEQALRILTIIGSTLSIAGLILTIFTMLFFK